MKLFDGLFLILKVLFIVISNAYVFDNSEG